MQKRRGGREWDLARVRHSHAGRHAHQSKMMMWRRRRRRRRREGRFGRRCARCTSDTRREPTTNLIERETEREREREKKREEKEGRRRGVRRR